MSLIDRGYSIERSSQGISDQIMLVPSMRQIYPNRLGHFAIDWLVNTPAMQD